MRKKDHIDLAFERKKKRQKVFNNPLPKKKQIKEDYSKYFYCPETKRFIYNPIRVYKTKKNRRTDRSYINIFNEYRGYVDYCQKCGSNLCLQIHHINKNPKDNHPLNLIKLCLPCHLKAHKEDKVYALMKKRLDFILKT